MSQDQPASSRSVEDVLNETREGRQSLQKMVEPLFIHLWTDFLNIVFEWFPHQHGDGSENERAFVAIRHRVLRIGNGQSRQMSMILQDFAIAQMKVREVIHRLEMPKHGVFGLPLNVKMPERKT